MLQYTITLNPMKTEDNWKKSYHKYLTEKLDRGAKNIVVEIATKILLKIFNKSAKQIRIADIGCYTGSIINRVYLNLPENIRKITTFVGLDRDKKITEFASRQRPHISFMQSDLTKNPPNIKPFQIVILSNVLHELYSEKLPNIEEAKSSVIKALHNVRKFMTDNGYLVILDGVLPNNFNQLINIKFFSKREFNKFIDFSKSNYIIPIICKRVGGNILQTTIGNFAAFLTKARYLKEDYWPQEAKQMYQYFTIDEFKETLLDAGIEIEEIIPQPVQQVENKLRIIDSNIEIPSKNILIKARRFS